VAINARRVLPRLVTGFFEEVRGFLEKDREPEELHRMRLAAKRLRYVIELFRPCYGAGLQERVEALKNLQDSLGDVNDAVATRARFGRRLGKKVQTFLHDRAAEKAKEFRKHWKETFDAEGQEKWWTEYLARSARAPKR
jgi:CHAD domain-containing protein